MDLPEVHVSVLRGNVPDAIVDQAREKVGGLLRLAPAPVLDARVALALEPSPDMQRPAVAKASLDVNGRPVRAHVAADTLPEAVDLLEGKLRQGLEMLTERRQARRHEPAAPEAGAWRRGMLPTSRPEWFPRPVEERELVRRKSYVLHQQRLAEAAEDLELLDQDWVLFTEATTGTDALLERLDDGFRLTLADGGALAAIPEDALDLGGPVELVGEVPRMDLATALDLLDELEAPLVFFVDAEDDRGRVVYRRYDGHYGTITRADGEPDAVS
jgi:ribosome-associated translation inhibitor RaiA